MKTEIRNAKIISTQLGGGDRGIFTVWITCEWQGGGQGFGGYSLDEPKTVDGKFDRRIGTAYGMEFIARILNAVGVDNWEDLKGKYIRIDHEHSKIHGIGHITDDKWFYPAKLAEEFGL